MLRTRSWNCALRATKSVSDLTSTIAPLLPSAITPISPSAAMRPALLAALERPFLRSQSTASSMWPSVSVSAALQSIMPAPVLSRSSFTRLAVIVVINLCLAMPERASNIRAIAGARRRRLAGASRGLTFGQLLGGADPVVARDAAPQGERLVEQRRVLHAEDQNLPEVVDAYVVETLLELDIDARQPLQVVWLAARSVDALERGPFGQTRQIFRRRLFRPAEVDALLELAALDAVDGGAGDEVAVERDRATGIVVTGHDEIDAVGITIGVDHGDDRNAKLLGLGNGNLLLVGVDHEQEVR